MPALNKIVTDLIEEGIASKAHFQTWWALRSLALPDYLDTMNDLEYVDFFHASNSGHYKLIFVTLSKIYDIDPKTSQVNSIEKSRTEHEQWLHMYRQKLKIRKFEENVNQLYTTAKMPGLSHLSIGQEAVAVGVCESLRSDDYITSTHRGHGHLVRQR